MFIRNIPLSKVKSAAKAAASHWYLCQRAFENGKQEEALRYAELALAEMVDKGRIVAGAALASLVVSALKSPVSADNRALVERSMHELDGELARLSNGKVRPTLHMLPLASAMAKAQGEAVPAVHALFLPVEPIAIAVDPGSEAAGSLLPFDQALEGYAREFSECMAQIKARGDLEPLKEMSSIASSIERRLPAGRTSLISGSFAAWAIALNQLLKAPSAAHLKTVIFTAGMFEAWLLKGIADRALPDDKKMLSRSLYNLIGCKVHKRAAVMVAEYGLDDIASQDVPTDLSVSLAVIEGYWQQAKMAWEEHLKAPTQDSLAKVHDAVSKFGTYASGGNEEILSMARALGELMRGLEPTPGAANAGSRAVISSAIAKSLDAVTKMISDRELGLSAVIALRMDMLGADDNGVDSIKTINPDDVVIPASALLHEIAVDVMAAAAKVEEGDAEGARNLMHMAVIAMSFLHGKINGTEAFDKAAMDLAGRTGSGWDGLPNAYFKLVRAIELFETHPDASMALINEIFEAVAGFDSRTIAQMQSAVPVDMVGDKELFEIFTAEMEEIFEAVDATLQRVQQAGQFDNQASIEICRSFHTVKGSATMSGLAHIGLCAWQVEKTVTDLMAQMHVPMSMCAAVELVKGRIQSAMVSLNDTGSASVDVAEIELAFSAFNPDAKAPVEVAQIEQAPVVQAPPALPFMDSSAAADVQDQIQDSGGSEIVRETTSKSSYLGDGVDPEIVAAFNDESVQLLRILKNELGRIRAHGVSSEMIRSAHGLAGMSRLVGFQSLRTAASMVEDWAEHFTSNPNALTDASIAAVGEVVADISRLIHAYHTHIDGEELRPGVVEALPHFWNDDLGQAAASDAPESTEAVEAEEETPAVEAEVDHVAAVDAVAEADVAVEPAAEAKPTLADFDIDFIIDSVAQVHEADVQDAAEEPAVQPERIEPPSLFAASTLIAPPPLPKLAPVEIVEAPVAEEAPEQIQSVAVAPVAHVQAQKPAPIQANSNSFVHLAQGVEDDIDEELLAAFRPEAEELLAELDSEVMKFSSSSDFKNINRLVHSLKGGTRMAGMLSLGAILHKMEDSTSSTVPLGADETKDLIEKIQNTLDYIRNAFDHREVAAEVAVGEQAQALVQQIEAKPLDSFIKVETAKVEGLLTMLGQLRIAQEGMRRQSRSSQVLLGESNNPLSRLRALSKQISIEAESKMESGSAANSSAFDALEMDRFSKMHEITRRLVEAVSDVDEIFAQTASHLESMKYSSSVEEDISDELDDAISKIGRTPLLAFQGRLRAVARQAANEVGKQVLLEVQGDIRLERAVADMLVPAIEHMIRNSLAHGIEMPAERERLGKPQVGSITVQTRNEGRYANIVVLDDGAGVNFDRVKQKAIDVGLIARDANPTQSELTSAMFLPGFSTATEVSELAGRGVGLDVVRDTIQRLGGRLTLTSEAGRGTRFSIQVPLSSSHVSGLLMSVQGKPYIVPSTLVRSVETIPSRRIVEATAGDRLLDMEDGTRATLVRLHDVCGVRPADRMPSFSTLVVPHDSSYAVFADHIEFVDNMPVRAFESQMQMGSGVLGHSILSDGRVALVINLKQAIAGEDSTVEFIPEIGLQQTFEKKVTIMVVDDSITVRALSKRFLTKNGFDVILAINGADAVEKLTQAKDLPDLILMDIEMPVMDGFEACTTIKAASRIWSVPLAFISSRNADKHRDYAKSIGAIAFFGKPYNEDAVLDLIRSIVGEDDFKNSSFVESRLEKAA